MTTAEEIKAGLEDPDRVVVLGEFSNLEDRIEDLEAEVKQLRAALKQCADLFAAIIRDKTQ